MSRRLSLHELIGFCTRMRHSLGAGLPLTRVFNDQAKKGPPAVRALAGSVATELEGGSSLHEALAHLPGAVPPLMLSLIEVGETTGMLPEVFAGLEKHFQQQQTRWRQFWSKATWPLIQFVMAILVLAGLIVVLGMLPINQKPGGGSFDPLGLGLRGTFGAMIFLGVIGGLALMLALCWRSGGQLHERRPSRLFPAQGSGPWPMPTRPGDGSVLHGSRADARDGDADRRSCPIEPERNRK